MPISEAVHINVARQLLFRVLPGKEGNSKGPKLAVKLLNETRLFVSLIYFIGRWETLR